MKTIKSTIGFATVCLMAAAMADGRNLASFEKVLAAKDSAGVSAGVCAAPTEAERLECARYIVMCDAKMDKCIGAANMRLRNGEALAADASMTLLKCMPDGGKIASNKIEKRAPLEVPAFNENDITMAKSLDSRIASESNNRIAGNDLPMTANVSEMTVAKTLGACVK